MTFDFPENDIRMSQYIADKVVEIGRAMGGKTVVLAAAPSGPTHTTVYQSTHNCGGAVMGDDPKTSVVNRYLQCWDVPNVFSIGASAFPQNGTYNYTGDDWCAHLLGDRCDQEPIPEAARPVGATMRADTLVSHHQRSPTAGIGLLCFGSAAAQASIQPPPVARGAIIAAQGVAGACPPARNVTPTTGLPTAAVRFHGSPVSRPIILPRSWGITSGVRTERHHGADRQGTVRDDIADVAAYYASVNAPYLP